MASVTVRNIPDEVHRALRVRAAQHGRSTEAEIRIILEQAAMPEGRRLMGSALSEIWGTAGLTEEEAAAIEGARDRRPATPMSFD
ncbi:Arc family DNA-binding protein (plasmid) [Sphingobium fuliginis]|jgi:plasmid stability protein|uniref:Arc family DNA-binding protein n=1 Tax=Sphingobium fuliginis (strain ATCC 27551) TaxID=336203 RepID=A0A7M2GPS4_SPHSA|nr:MULTISPECIES: Arc family DNA-binding protein [Sphingobium]QOT74528.1 Arc family DNA-binding protein [Sphingobium fuliginis]